MKIIIFIVFVILLGGCIIGYQPETGSVMLEMTPDEILRLYEMSRYRNPNRSFFITKDETILKICNDGTRYNRRHIRLACISDVEIMELKALAESGATEFNLERLKIIIKR